MWKRSQVEQLTGLTRHMIQDLCNPNTQGDGLGLWEPAVSKPGYSRFDEGDLLAFYLVRQLMKAGFTLREAGPAVFDLLEEDDAFTGALKDKEADLRTRRDELDGKLSTISYLEAAAAHPVDDRLFAVMEAAVMQSVRRAASSTCMAREGVGEAGARDACMVEQTMGAFAAEVLNCLRGAPLSAKFKEVRRAVSDAAHTDASPSGVEAARAVALLARTLLDATAADEDAYGGRAMASGTERVRDASSQLGDSRRLEAMLMQALASFLAEPENGVPVELVFGEGSFVFLARANAACVRQLEVGEFE